MARTKDPDGVEVVDSYKNNVLLSSQNANNDTVVHRYTGRLNKSLVVDPKGNQEETRFDEQGNPVSRTAPEPFSFYGYDNLGRRISKQLGAGGVTYTYGYDAKNRLVSAADPAGVQSLVYDDTDRLTSATRGDETFKYDTTPRTG